MQAASSMGTLQTVTQFLLSNLIFDSDLFDKVELKPTTRLVLITLCRYYPNIFPSMETIMKKAGIVSKETINNSLKELKKKGLLIYSVDKQKKSNNYRFTAAFFEYLKIEPEQYDSQVVRSTEIVLNKTNYKTNKKTDSFSYKNLLDMSKTNTIAYYEQTLNLSGQDKEHLCKIKLNRTSLTSFQRENLDKFIMLSDSEIIAVNNKEPYFRQENIDIYYNSRMKKIKEFQEQPQKQEENTTRKEKEETLAMLKAGYKAFSNNKAHLISFLKRNKDKIELFSITESELCC